MALWLMEFMDYQLWRRATHMRWNLRSRSSTCENRSSAMAVRALADGV